MRNYLLVALATVMVAALSSCDGYTFQGRDGPENRALADSMPMAEAYAFYLETYRGTNPPMLDVALTFSRFGPTGTNYLAAKALRTDDAVEFEATLRALLVLEYRCTSDLASALTDRGRRLEAEVSVQQICRSSA